jgi:hypothetical protein
MKERAKLFKLIENYNFDTKRNSQDTEHIDDSDSLFQFLKIRKHKANMYFHNLMEFSNILISLIIFYILCQYICFNKFDPFVFILFDGSFIISAMTYSFIIKHKKGKKFSASYFKYCLIAFITSKFFHQDRFNTNLLFKIYVCMFD